jgi:YD repeat-containing protein
MIRRFLCAVVAAAAVAGLTLAPASAGVTLRNGNFYVSYTDVVVPGGFEMKIERVYNSKTDFAGIFGSGWGFEYEAYLRVQDDGSVVVHEYGGGADNHFMPVTTKPRPLDAIYDELTAAAEKLGQFSSVAERDAYRAWVVDHHEEEFERFRKLGLVKTEHLGIGQVFRSGRFGNQVLSRVPEGYQRAFDTGRFEEYNLSGQLVRVWDANHNFVALHYDAKGHLTTMEDNGGNRFVFTFNKQGYVASIAWGAKVARYAYKGSDLVKSTDVDGHTFAFTYDAAGRHNMMGIHYADGTDMKITYYPLDQFENVKQVKDRDGTLYDYQYDRSIKDHYKVTVTETDTDHKVVVNTYEYFIGHAPSGDIYTSRMVESLNGDVSDTTYNADADPLSITHNGVTTRFEYDSFGHVTLKQTASQTIQLTYDPVVRKVASVTTTANGKTTVVSFKYDAKGNLVEGTDSAGHEVAVTYDDNGRISTLAENSAGTMHIAYNRDSQPVQVVVDGLGTISVTYKQNGDVAKISSEAGDAVAQKVVALFQQMMAVVKPPAVSLTF